MTEKPRRAFELAINISADDWGSAVHELRYLVSHIEDHGPDCNSTSGSPSSGHRVSISHDPAMTHERYFADVDKFLAKDNPSKAPPAET